jgi:hypothetical protein
LGSLFLLWSPSGRNRNAPRAPFKARLGEARRAHFVHKFSTKILSGVSSLMAKGCALRQKGFLDKPCVVCYTI